MTPEKAIAIAKRAAKMCNTMPAKLVSKRLTDRLFEVNVEVSANFFVYVTIFCFDSSGWGVSTDLNGKIYNLWKIVEEGVVDVPYGGSETS